jgi:hypothetical protein
MKKSGFQVFLETLDIFEMLVLSAAVIAAFLVMYCLMKYLT